MVIRTPDGSVTTIDHRENALSGATQEVYLDDEGNAVRSRSLFPLPRFRPGERVPT
jgi:gamma-glutamyltranspeptidase/glutathione hydrolase